MKPHAIIVDLDGTVADNSHRAHHLDKSPKDWDAFFAGTLGDTPKLLVIQACIHFCAILDYYPIFVTGRSEGGDFRKDEIVKEEIYRESIEPHYDVCLAIDDRACVVALWRRIGIECWQVADGPA